ncbi:MAG: hypothetical protein ACLGXA_15150 [Acidobacteriota bacterium]
MRLQLHGNPHRRAWPALGLAAAVLVSSGFAQSNPSPGHDAAALVRRAVANHLAAETTDVPQRFVLHKKDDRRDYSQLVIETRQGDVAMAIAANGAPLPPSARRMQIDRLDKIDANPALQEHRLKREQEDTARVNKLMRLLPDAFLYHYEATVPCLVSAPAVVATPVPTESAASSGTVTPTVRECYRLTFRPNPRWDPPDTESRLLKGMAGDVLIDQTGERMTRLNAHLVTDVDFGWGIIGHLDKGGTIFLEQSEVAPNQWELTRMKLNLTGRALMVKSLRFHISEEMSHYAPVPADLDYHQAIAMLKAEAVRGGE